MPIINQEQRWVYYFHPRTASRATADWLVDNVPGSLRPPGNHHAEYESPLKRKLVPKNMLHWREYQTVRNPCDWVTSVFLATQAYRGKYPRLIDWFKDGMPGIPYGPDRSFFWRFPNATSILKYETLERDLAFSFETQARLHWNEAHKTKGKEMWFTNHWGIEEIKFAEEHFVDLKRYGYSI